MGCLRCKLKGLDDEARAKAGEHALRECGLRVEPDHEQPEGVSISCKGTALCENCVGTFFAWFLHPDCDGSLITSIALRGLTGEQVRSIRQRSRSRLRREPRS